MSVPIAVEQQGDLLERLRSVPAPAPILVRERERGLTDRQRELLDELGRLFVDGFAHFTMGELAAALNCSLRTLYTLAPSRDELVMIVVDRHLRGIGGSARRSIAPGMAPLDALRRYLEAATVAVSRTTPGFARDLEATPGGRELSDGHNDYLVAVTRTLLDLAVDRGDIGDVDTAAVALVMAGLGRDFARAETIPMLRSTPKAAADAVVDLILRGLQASPSKTKATGARA